MSRLDRMRLNTIRGRLWLGFGVLVALLVVAGVVARTLVHRHVGRRSRRSLARGAGRSAARELAVGGHRQDHRSGLALSRDARHGGAERVPQVRLGRARSAAPDERPARIRRPTEVAIVASIDNKLSAMEVSYALAHRLADLGRTDAAQSVATKARGSIDDLLNNIERLGAVKAQKVATRDAATRRRNRPTLGVADRAHRRWRSCSASSS